MATTSATSSTTPFNLGTLNVDSTGRVSFSGLASNIDFNSVVDQIMTARQIPVDNIKTDIKTDQDKVTALQDLEAKLQALQSSLANLYGAVSFRNANDMFEAKQVFASTSRADGAAPSAAATLIGASVTNAATAGTHTIEVLQTAKAQKITSDQVASTTTALGFADNDQFVIGTDKPRTDYLSDVQADGNVALGSSGTLSFVDDQGNTLGTVAYVGTDTLNDLAAAISANVTGVTATIETDANGARLNISSGTAFKIDETGGGTATRDFEIGVRKVTVNASMTLGDLRDAINSANSGDNASGVTASIVTVSSSESYLFLTAADTGVSMKLQDVTGTPLQSVGVLTAGGTVKNQVQAAQKAQLYADGLLDQTDTAYESALQSADTDTVGSTGTLHFTLDGGGSTLGDIAYTSSDTLASLRDKINTAGIGVTASIVTDGAGVRLDLTGPSAFSFSETGGGSAITDLGLTNKRLVIERSSNTISDLFTGVTLTLNQPEKGTTIQLDIEKDLSQVKTQIQSFVTAYNTVRQFINQQRLVDPTTGEKSADAGVLFSSDALSTVSDQLSSILGEGTAGVSPEFSAFAQIGIDFVPISTTDPTQANTLQLDESKLDAALLNNPDDVRKLFSFDFTASDSRVTLLGFNGNTSYSSSGYTLNIDGTTANINGDPSGADDGSATLNNGTVTVNSGGAQGLSLFANGFTSATSVQVNYTVGIGARLYFAIQDLLQRGGTTDDPIRGPIEGEIDTLNDQIDFDNQRVTDMTTRLDMQRQDLTSRFLNMESAIAKANTIMSSIKQMTASLAGGNDS